MPSRRDRPDYIWNGAFAAGLTVPSSGGTISLALWGPEDVAFTFTNAYDSDSTTSDEVMNFIRSIGTGAFRPSEGAISDTSGIFYYCLHWVEQISNFPQLQTLRSAESYGDLDVLAFGSRPFHVRENSTFVDDSPGSHFTWDVASTRECEHQAEALMLTLDVTNIDVRAEIAARNLLRAN